MIYGQNILFKNIKTPVESRMMTRVARELADQKEEQKRQKDIPDADDSSCTRYLVNNEKPLA